MTDRISQQARSMNMSRIKSKDTLIEVEVRKFLYHHGIRYRKNYKKLPGTPDIAITSKKIAIFVHGCFWHGHLGCRYAVTPKTRTEFWKEKILKNKMRDAKNVELLNNLEWSVIIIWECDLKNDKEYILQKLLKQCS